MPSQLDYSGNGTKEAELKGELRWGREVIIIGEILKELENLNKLL